MEGLIVAGGIAPPELRERGVKRIPLLRIQGESILDRTCRSLVDGGGCESVGILAPEEVPLPPLSQARRCPYSGDMISDLTAAVKGLSGAGLLIATGDMPLISPAAVGAIARYVQETGAEVVYPVVEQSTMEARGLGAGRTYKKVGGRTLTGCNLFYVNREWVLRQEPLLRGLFEQRKNPMALAKFFGAGFLFRVAAGSLTLEYGQEYLSKRVGAIVRTPVVEFAELAADLDKIEDVATFAPYLDTGQLTDQA